MNAQDMQTDEAPESQELTYKLRHQWPYKAIKSGECGGFSQPKEDFTFHQVNPKMFVTGWQLIDYLEFLQLENRTNV